MRRVALHRAPNTGPRLSSRARMPTINRAPARQYSSASSHRTPPTRPVRITVSSSAEHDSSRYLWAVGLFAAGVAVSQVANSDDDAEKIEPIGADIGVWRNGLPVYTRADVQKHKTKDSRIWVTFRAGVYDITDFLPAHPGQERILMAAGGSIEPFWAMYGVHNNKHIGEMLEELRIGNLDPKDQAVVMPQVDLYANEPHRDPRLVVRSNKPFNAETPLAGYEERITPNELFYVRNHLPVPEIDPDRYVLEVVVEGKPPVKYTLEDLQQFPVSDVEATIQCAGNRRNEMSRIKTVKGGFWDVGAISNAVWSGPRLRDILIASGLTPDGAGLQHVQFEGLDRDFEKFYGASIPMEKAISPDGDVVLALKMNGKTLPVDHGFPVRVVAPGIVGARNVKWLGKVVASMDESSNHWQQNDYKGFSPSIDWHNVDFKSAPAIQELPVQSAITSPTPNATVTPGGDVSVHGYAWSGGGRGIVRVDVSADGGKTWHIASLNAPNQARSRVWAWSLWNAKIPIPKDVEKVSIMCKAVDTSYNMQPERVEPIWNLRGVLSNAWHRVDVNVGKV